MKKKIKELKGNFVVMVTPFDENQNINFKAMEENIEWYIEKGAHGLIPLGSTGEMASLTEKERYDIAEFVVKIVNNRLPVCICATAETTTKTIEYTQHAEKIGADAVLILPPYYYNPIQEEIIYHYETIADAVSIPIMIYNNPGASGVDIQLETVLKLAEKENIKYIKESTGDIIRLREIERLGHGNIITFCGSEELVFESFFLGAQGWVSVISNALPELSSAIYQETVINKNYKRAQEIYHAILPLCIELEESGKLVQIIKYCMDRRGVNGGNFRSPRLPLSKEYCKKIDRLLENAIEFMK
ncbi:MAG: 4-hydroxy-tetrahydrodipicolinate synthase [Candidatus Atribacteria bacterium]|nr:4-hydroxy-tetrahydrodipicolinate synthase [Candidatus Atribacteria bacterium]